MGTHYILIDYENVQPDDLAPLHAHATGHSHFGRELDFDGVQALVDALVERGCVRFEGETVHYARPIPPAHPIV